MKWEYRGGGTWELGVDGEHGSVISANWCPTTYLWFKPSTCFWPYVGTKRLEAATTSEDAMEMVEKELPDLLRMALVLSKEAQ